MIGRRIASVLAILAASACTASTPVHAQAARPARDAAPAVKVIAEGDSITQGGVTGARDAWPARLRNRVCGVNCTIMTNDGQPGTCLAAVGCGAPGTRLVDRWQSEVLDQHPTTVIILIGVNDLWFPGTSIDQIADGFKTVVFSAIGAGIQPVVLTIGPMCPNAGPYGFLEPRREAINGWLTSYFGTGPGSVVLDTAQSLRVPWGQQLDPHYSVDGCGGTDSMHMNPWGQLILADAIPLDRIR